MKLYTKFKPHTAVKMGTAHNDKGQRVVFYEHPTLGSDAPIVGMIEGVAFHTDFFDVGDFHSGGDYVPVLLEDGTVCNQFECR